MDDDDKWHLDRILRVLRQADEWAARTDAQADRIRPVPGSSLCGDDDQAHPYDLSHAVWHSLSTAVDHLSCLRTVLGDAKVIHMFAPFSLVRAALENASAAIWMLEPSSQGDRLARRLRLAIGDIKNGEQVKQLTGQLGPRSEQERINQIADIASRAGLDGAALKRISYSEIVRAVEASGPANHVVEVSWKLCSGYAHGDWWAMLSASRRDQIPGPAQEGIGTFKIEANLSLLANVTTLAVSLTGRGWRLYDQGCLPPQG